MRILANENVPGEAVEALRSRGHDVMWVRTAAPGIEDRRVVHLAETEERVIVTFDKDFGKLAFQAKLPLYCGVILLRISGSDPNHVETSL
jgi:predicted nuclease of predicted toxin-antitoxin system